DRRLGSQDLRHPPLQALDPLPGAVAVRPLVGRRRGGDLDQLLVQRGAAVPAAQEALGAGDGRLDAGLVGHQGTTTRAAQAYQSSWWASPSSSRQRSRIASWVAGSCLPR